MKPIPTLIHGLLDYATVGVLLVVPRLLGASPTLTRTVGAAGAGVLGYSLLTRYELGAVKVLPMRAHLAMDAVSGLLLCAAPLLFRGESAAVRGFLVAKGAMELAVTATSQTEPPGSSIDDAEATLRSAGERARERVTAL
jgi:hypothetical protein